MKFGQQGWSGQRRRRGQRIPISAHKSFVPLLALWGALLGGLSIMMLPPALTNQAFSGTPIGAWGFIAQPLLAGVAAAGLGVVLFGAATLIQGRKRRHVSTPRGAERAPRQVTPINPLRDLGTPSLDEPIAEMPFTTSAWRDADLDEPEHAYQDGDEPERDAAPANAPLDLDLAAFAELPGRNAVWVEETHVAAAQAPAPAPVASDTSRATQRAAAPAPAPGSAALARLRAVPTDALSLAEMVERFAGGLHEHRTTRPSRVLAPAELAAREAALAEALKALAALSGEAPERPQGLPADDALRAALAQLQPRRGAA